MPLDMLATAPHYVDHLLPIWDKLPVGERGHFYLGKRAWRNDIPGAREAEHVGRDARHPILVVAHGDFKIVRAAGRRKIALGQHGAGQSYGGQGGDHPSYPGGRDQAEVGLFLVPNEHAAARTRARYPKARVELVGCPKIDRLPRRLREGPRPLVAFSFHFSTAVALETRSAYPMYRGHVAALGRKMRLLGHAHPRYMSQLAPWYRSNRIEVASSLDEVFRRADVYVCDNSSSLFEFASTGRPVVLLNTPWYRPAVDHGLRFEASKGCAITAGPHFCGAAHVGIAVDRPRDLEAAILRAIEDPPALAAAREAALRVVYQPRRGGARLAVKALLGWAA